MPQLPHSRPAHGPKSTLPRQLSLPAQHGTAAARALRCRPTCRIPALRHARCGRTLPAAAPVSCSRVPPKVHAPQHHLQVHHRVAVFDILPGGQRRTAPPLAGPAHCEQLQLKEPAHPGRRPSALHALATLLHESVGPQLQHHHCSMRVPGFSNHSAPLPDPLGLLQASRRRTALSPSGTSPTWSARPMCCASWPRTSTGGPLSPTCFSFAAWQGPVWCHRSVVSREKMQETTGLPSLLPPYSMH